MIHIVKLPKLPERFVLTATLTPVFWFAYLWSLYLSPEANHLPLRTVVVLLLGISVVSAYCVALFALTLKNRNQSIAVARKATSKHQGEYAQTDQ